MVIVGLVIGFYVVLLVGLAYSALSRFRRSARDEEIHKHKANTRDVLPLDLRRRAKVPGPFVTAGEGDQRNDREMLP